MSLYKVNMKNGEYTITKLTDDLEPELGRDGKIKTYSTSTVACTCPAGHRDTCRHRQMLPEFTAKNRVNSAWLLDFDNGQWFYYDAEHSRILTEAPVAVKTKRGLFEHGLRRRI